MTTNTIVRMGKIYNRLNMNSLKVLILLLICPFCLSAQKFIVDSLDNSALIEYHDGKQWAYRNIDGLTIGMTNEELNDDYGKYYQIEIFISNNRDTALLFNPEEVYAELRTKKGDTLDLEVYTNEAYQKKIKKAQTWTRILNAVATGLNSANAGYSNTYSTSYSTKGYPITTISRTYDANAATQANIAANKEIQAMNEKMEQDLAVREEGYLKLNTLNPGDAIIGYMNIKHKKGNELLVTINAGQNKYLYLWDVEKKKADKKKDKKDKSKKD